MQIDEFLELTKKGELFTDLNLPLSLMNV